MSKEIEHSKNISKTFSNISDFAKGIEPAEFTRANCKFCCSAYRKEAEVKYTETPSFSAVKNYLISKGEEISLASIKNHLTYHFGRKEIEERLKEYHEEMDRWRKLRPSKVERLQDFIDILYRKIHLLEAQTDSPDPKDKAKNAEVLAKMIDQVNKCQAEIDKHRQETEIIRIFINRFTEIVEVQMKENISKEVSNILASALVTILEEAHNLVGDLS